MRGMEHRVVPQVGLLSGDAGAEKIEEGGDALAQQREILRRHVHGGNLYVFHPEYRGARVRRGLQQRLAVENSARDRYQLELTGAAEFLRSAVRHKLNTLEDALAHVLFKTADVAGYLGVVDRGGERRTGLDGAHGQHGGLKWADIAAYDSLKRHDEAGDGHRRVDIFLRRARMAAFADELNAEAIFERHERPGLDADGADRQLRQIVQSENGAGLVLRKDVVLKHVLCALELFLRRLEHKEHVRAKLVPVRAQQHRRTEQPRRMGVVPAAVHDSGGEGFVRPVIFLVLHDSVNVRAQRDGRVPAAAEQPHDAGLKTKVKYLNTELLKLGADDGAGALFLKAQLRMGVKVGSNRINLFGIVFFCLFKKVQKSSLLSPQHFKYKICRRKTQEKK